MPSKERGREKTRKLLTKELNHLIKNNTQEGIEMQGTFYCKDGEFKNLYDFYEHIRTCDNLYSAHQLRWEVIECSTCNKITKIKAFVSQTTIYNYICSDQHLGKEETVSLKKPNNCQYSLTVNIFNQNNSLDVFQLEELQRLQEDQKREQLNQHNQDLLREHKEAIGNKLRQSKWCYSPEELQPLEEINDLDLYLKKVAQLETFQPFRLDTNRHRIGWISTILFIIALFLSVKKLRLWNKFWDWFYGDDI